MSSLLIKTNKISKKIIEFENFSLYGLIRKDSITHIHLLSLKNSVDSCLCFRLALFHSVSYFFLLYRSPSLSLCTAFNSVQFNIDEVLSSNPSANVFVFGKCNVHDKGYLYCSDGTGRPGELCQNFSVLDDLTQIVNLPTPIPDCGSHRRTFLFWICFFF